MMDNQPKRYQDQSDFQNIRPVHVVWEITLACNLKCNHCGSRAGKVRPDELSKEQCFELIEHLAQLGTREITIIGGEAFLRRDWIEIIEKIVANGIDCSMQTGAYKLTEERIIQAKAAGINNIGISIDGLKETHNTIRGRQLSYDYVINAFRLLKKHDILSSANTVITQTNKNELGDLLDILIKEGVKNWQIQLMVAMGNAVENDQMLIQPYEIIDLHDRLFQLYQKARSHDLIIQPGNNIGYFGPYEHIWRQGFFSHYAGCGAGHTIMGIEADGKIKGCPSLPSTDYTGGNVKDMSVADIWKHTEALAFTRKRTANELWGGCKSCYYADVCLSGCTWTSHVLFGQRGNNPYCYHRALELKKQSRKERIVKLANASGKPFDYGLFQIEVLDEQGKVVEVQRKPEKGTPIKSTENLRELIQLKVCRGCERHVYQNTKVCPFCTADVEELETEYQKNLMEVEKAFDRLTSMMDQS